MKTSPQTSLTLQDAEKFVNLLPKTKNVVYKQIPACIGYWAGSDGTIWRFYPGRKRLPFPRWKKLATPLDRSRTGTPVVNVGTGKCRRHVALGPLILETFIGPKSVGMECCHFPDKSTSNCCLDNLMWGSGKQNQEHQRLHGTLVGGERHGMAILTNKQVLDIRTLRKYLKGCEIASMYGISTGHVSMIQLGKARTDSSNAGKGLGNAPINLPHGNCRENVK